MLITIQLKSYKSNAEPITMQEQILFKSEMSAEEHRMPTPSPHAVYATNTWKACNFTPAPLNLNPYSSHISKGKLKCE